MKNLLYALLLISGIACSQIQIIHFNASWNAANDVSWFDDLTDALEYKKDLEKKKAKLEELLKSQQLNKIKAKAKPLNEESEVEDSQAENVSEDKPTKEAPQ